jgi:hypothetical protein
MDRLDLGWFLPRFALLEKLMWAALGGGLVLPVGLMLGGAVGTLLMVVGALAIVPFVLYLAILPVLHWKDGYRGRNSSLWGALLVIETSGWFKIVYWLRHLLPDYRRARRAASAPADR